MEGTGNERRKKGDRQWTSWDGSVRLCMHARSFMCVRVRDCELIYSWMPLKRFVSSS